MNIPKHGPSFASGADWPLLGIVFLIVIGGSVWLVDLALHTLEGILR